jgi:predicted metalloprotease with PDZ domain
MFSDRIAIRQNRPSNDPRILSWSHYIVIVSGLCAVAVVVTILALHDVSEVLYRLAVRQYERDFGFEVGLVRNWPHASEEGMWGIVQVRPGGTMDRAGVRSGDAVITHHGAGFAFLHWAVTEAAAGRAGCVDVLNVEDARAGRFMTREVCLDDRAQK